MLLAETGDLAFSVAGWTMVVIFFVATVYWLFEMLVVGRSRRGLIEHEPGDVEDRVLTVGAESVVQATVNALPDTLAAIRVVCEEEIDITGASVHQVPADFSCDATRKGRAVEWARRHVPCQGSYTLYLDEDTLLPEFHGLPDADIVQLSEQPIRSDSWLAYFAEIFRMGFQIEQATFPNFRYPLYAWGGGFAVRKTVEDEVTWDVHSVTEDTNFIWRAFENADYDLAYLRTRAMNQAPPSIREMISQRRRWISGAARDAHLLPRRYHLLSLLRNAAWGLVCLSPFLALPLVTPVENVLLPEIYGSVVVFQLIGLFAWGFLGYWYYGERISVLIGLFLTLPVVALIHSVGALWALLRPVQDFRVTTKVPPKEVADETIEEVDIDEPETEGATPVRTE